MPNSLHSLLLSIFDTLHVHGFDVQNLVPIIADYVLSKEAYSYAELLCWTHRPSKECLETLMCNHKAVEELQVAGYTLHHSFTPSRYPEFKGRLDYRVYSDLAYAFYSSSSNFPVQPYMNRPPPSGYVPTSAFLDLATYDDADEFKATYSNTKANSLLLQAKKETRQEYRARDAYQRYQSRRR